MAENLTQYKAYPPLLALLQQHGLPKDTISHVSDGIAQIVAEALQARQGGQAAAGPVKVQQQQQAAAAPAAAPVRDLQSADAVLQGVSLIIPRGKFDMGFYADSLQVTSKQTSALIPYSSIQHVLVIDAIPKQPSTTNIVLVMKPGHPVQQGKNQLDMVVVQTKDQPELSLPAPAACQELGDTLAGPAAVVLSTLLASYIEDIGDSTFLTADSSVFSSSSGDLMIAANRGATPGWLVPLSAGLCYIGKPGRFLPSSAISKVAFHRAGGGSSTFDITIKPAKGFGGGSGGAAAAAGKALELGQIDAAELVKLQGYLMAQRIRIDAAELVKLQGYLMAQRIRIGTDDDDDDDEDDAAPQGAAAAAAAGAGVAAGAAAAAGDESDDDEEDEDFDPDASSDEGEQRSSKKPRLADAAADVDEEEEDDDEEEDGASDDGGSSDDSSEVSLVDEDAMEQDSEDL
ncbi:hypothetical protein OEZ85_011674 [Tetradesmus obliquus]|uniref:FACT complex subunit SSRP1 n=1 Tax=Tetradesmus obliquus TaxID=3088 RepID=A0ABY8TUZ8_TETOB|nr:hypothetical protein OEZ85_011674 [Tetradesmus obliquus]